jgi:NAD(P)-dependent dehydrogenase (short-subunit alcohol dehydrogenase family)
MLDHLLEDMNAVANGSGRIGHPIAQALQKAGAAVAILIRNKEKRVRAAASLQSHELQAQAFRVDVTNWARFQEPSLRIEQEIISVDALVNSQGVANIQPAEVTKADFAFGIAANLDRRLCQGQPLRPRHDGARQRLYPQYQLINRASAGRAAADSTFKHALVEGRLVH